VSDGIIAEGVSEIAAGDASVIADPALRRNRYTFGIGTIGRDMVYTLVSMFLIVYLTNVLHLPSRDLGLITGIIVGFRVLDAINDPLIGMVVDNTRTRWGKHKPWIAIGALLSGLATILLFRAPGLSGNGLVFYFAIVFFFWAITYSFNDIAFWSYVPALSQDQKERENIGAKARIFALIGVFFVVAGNVPIIAALSNWAGSEQRAYFFFAIIVAVILWLGQLVTLIGVKEPVGIEEQHERTTFRDFARAIFHNDQLLYIAIAMALFMIGYTTTTSFGLFYFQYVFGNEGMFPIFAAVLGVSQIASLLLFPLATKRWPRKTIYLIATILVVLGYLIFFVAPTTTMVFIAIAGILIFLGQAAIQLLMLLFLADTVDYGHWKLGKRNDSVTFSLQPFINKAGGAAATGIVGATAILTGLNHATVGEYLLTGGNLLIFKIAMFVIPLLCILIGFLIYHFKFTIDEETYAGIHRDLVDRGELLAADDLVAE